MAKRDQYTFPVDASPDKVLEVMLTPEFQEAREKAQGAIEVTTEIVSKTDTQAEQRVTSKVYARGVTGIDKSKTEQQITTYDWDLKARKASWITETAQGKKAKVWGETRIEADGDGSLVTNEFNVEIKIPLVGGKIEKMVMKEVPKGFRDFEKVVCEYAQ